MALGWVVGEPERTDQSGERGRWDQGEMDEVFMHARRSLDLALELGETASEAWALYSLGEALAHAGRFAAAVTHFDRCLKVADQCGEAFLIGGVLCSRAEAAAWWGHPESRAWAEEALAAVANDDVQSVARAKLTIASLLADEQPDEASRLFEEVANLLESWPGTGKADALLRKAALRISTHPLAEVTDEIEHVRSLTTAMDTPELDSRCHLEQTRLHLAHDA